MEEQALRIHPDRETFDALARDWPLVPMWADLTADVSTPVGVFPELAGDGPGVILESVERSERWGRYSFVAGDPAAIVTVDADALHVGRVRRELPIDETSGGATEALKAVAERLRAPHLPGLPPVTGGLVGYLSYEAAMLLDGHPYPEGGDLHCPPIQMLVIDQAIVFDHWLQRLLLITHVRNYDEGVAALEHLAEHVRNARAPEPLSLGEEATKADFGPPPDADRFRENVIRAKEHIFAGDIFQVVLARRRSAPAPTGGLPIYRRLRVANPSPYMFFLRAPELELAGSSPEPLVRVEGRRVSTRPIAGTFPRGRTKEEDLHLERRLLADAKERAEHAMLVDLSRNDLGRVCRAGTVEVTELMTVERFSRVMHIVSTVEGELENELSALDALAATFPAGTVTGAPKRRAMEIIAESESVARGPYAGAVGYLTFAGDLDFCITIRTAVIAAGTAYVQSGAGVVADSDPGRELAETEAKASALLAAVEGSFVEPERIGATP
jgi:anthranilate synthase component I